MGNEHVPETHPREDVEMVVPVFVNPDEDHHEAADRAGLLLSDKLFLSVERDVAVQRDVAELPGRATTGFHLD
ncbi:MAG: hypothetical protein H7A45_03880 [Verrucomicrobiales bacterium]|nr:hypothetical protein [Verrucomicrobiales bacterium]